jgi:hypothetical protein
MSSHDDAKALEYRRPSTAQLDRIEAMVREIRDALVAQAPVPPGGHYAAAFPAVMETTGMDGGPRGMTLDGMAMGASEPKPEPSPLMAMLSAPLPGKAGPDSLYPDPTECPGALNDAVTQDTIMQTIGVVGWTATIRPSAAEMGAMKAAYCKAHGIPDPTKGEWDHFVSLELGGAPRDPKNLWWQRYEDATHDIGAHCKDRVENALKRQIVAGQITLAEGQRLIQTDWYAVYLKLNKLGMLPMLMTFDPSGDADEDDNA